MEKGFFSLLHIFLSAVFDLIFPPVCLHCNRRIVRQTEYLCSECEADLHLLTNIQCPVCGFPIQDQICFYCQENEILFDRAVSIYEYKGPIRTLIHYLKFGDMPGIAGYLSEKALLFLERNKIFMDSNIITAIPLHSVRKRQRGYNQSSLIAQHIAGKMKWCFRTDILFRKKATVPQANLIKAKRRKNVEQAFSIKKLVDLKQQNILLLDDVFTTGATVQAACRELKKAHPGKIYVLTIGRA